MFNEGGRKETRGETEGPFRGARLCLPIEECCAEEGFERVGRFGRCTLREHSDQPRVFDGWWTGTVLAHVTSFR
jgi:hypothetical protein